jgi:glycosyltransferase involved in cell wall biosynthesis
MASLVERPPVRDTGTKPRSRTAPEAVECHDPLLLQHLLSRVPDPEDGRGRRRNRRATVSIVVAALNEEPNLPFVLPRIAPWVDEVILVDGHSTDRTCEVARTLLPEIRVVEQDGSGGKGEALRQGFDAARGDLIVALDADGSTDPRELPLFVGGLAAGRDFVKGTRFAQGGGSADMTLLRRAGNRALVCLVRLLFGGRYSDLCYGYCAFWKRVLSELDLDAEGFEIETQMNVQALESGLRVAEVPSFERRRLHGKSNLRTFPDGWRVLKTIVREWARRPRRATAGDGIAVVLPDA